MIRTLSPPIGQPAASRLQLWAEVAILFVGVPVAMFIWFDELRANRLLFPIILSLMGIALVLLARTPGWKFRDLWRGPVLAAWPIFLAFSLVTSVIVTGLVFLLNPDYFLFIVANRPELWLFIMLAYPVFSAFPQEIIYRTLFFERYQALFPSITLAIVANAVLFGWGHLFYDNWVAQSLTVGGGLVMAWAYLRHRSTLTSWVLHAISGNLIFTGSLGPYFYSGMVGTT